MQDKYSLAKCEQYGRRLAARLSQQFFGPRPDATLDGPALLRLTPLKQVNLLVLRQLLGHWQQEANSLRSPYFDFEAEAVRAALAQFMNVLSRHIRLDRAALEPLVAQAAAHTLLLAADPAAAFERLLLPAPDAGADETVPLPYLRDGLRYFDASKPFFQGFVDSLPGGAAPLDREFLRQRFALYLTAHAKELPTVAQLVPEFSQLLPLTEADLWGDGPAKPAAAPPTPQIARPDAPRPQPDEARPRPEPARPRPDDVRPQPDATRPRPDETRPRPDDVRPRPDEAPPQPDEARPRPEEVRPPAAEPSAAGVPLYEKLKATQPAAPTLSSTLREAAHAEAGTSLAERGAPRITSLREAISINQRFSFINELFNGENMEYHAVIQHLDTLPTAEEATAYVRQRLATTHDGGRKEEHLAKLLKLIERKFAEA